MKINELIIQIDEAAFDKGLSVGSFGGRVKQNVKDFWKGMKFGYNNPQFQLTPAQKRNMTAVDVGQQPQAADQQVAQQPSDPVQQPQASDQQPQTSQQASSAQPAQPTEPPEMKSNEIIQGLNAVWSKATANQGSQTTSPQVQAQIRAMAKQAGMTGQRIESKDQKFYSKFLLMEI